MTTIENDRAEIRTRVYLVLAVRRVALSQEPEYVTYRGHQLDLTADSATCTVTGAGEPITAPASRAGDHEGSLALALAVDAAIDAARGDRR